PRLAIAFGSRHAEVAAQVLLGAAPLLVPEDHHRLAAKTAHAADDRLVVAEGAIAVQLDEVFEQARHVVERERTQRMARQQHLLPGRQLAEDLALQLARFTLQAADLQLELRAPELLELGDLVFQLHDRALEVERLAGVDHGRHAASIARVSSSAWV